MNSHMALSTYHHLNYSGIPLVRPTLLFYQKSGLSSGVEINTFMFRYTLSSDLSRGGRLSLGWPLKMGSTVSTIKPKL